LFRSDPRVHPIPDAALALFFIRRTPERNYGRLTERGAGGETAAPRRGATGAALKGLLLALNPTPLYFTHAWSSIPQETWSGQKWSIGRHQLSQLYRRASSTEDAETGISDGQWRRL